MYDFFALSPGVDLAQQVGILSIERARESPRKKKKKLVREYRVIYRPESALFEIMRERASCLGSAKFGKFRYLWPPHNLVSAHASFMWDDGFSNASVELLLCSFAG